MYMKRKEKMDIPGWKNSRGAARHQGSEDVLLGFEPGFLRRPSVLGDSTISHSKYKFENCSGIRPRPKLHESLLHHDSRNDCYVIFRDHCEMEIPCQEFQDCDSRETEYTINGQTIY